MSAPSTGTSMLGRRKGSRRSTLSKLTGKFTLMLLLVLLFLLLMLLLLCCCCCFCFCFRCCCCCFCFCCCCCCCSIGVVVSTSYPTGHSTCRCVQTWLPRIFTWMSSPNWPLTATMMSVMIKYTGDLPFVRSIISLSSSVQGGVARTISSQKMFLTSSSGHTWRCHRCRTATREDRARCIL